MKQFAQWLSALMLFASSAFLNAEEIEYKAKVIRLFEQSSSCQIKGVFSWKDVDCDVNYAANSNKQIEEIKKCFLDVNAKYIGLDNFERSPSMYSSNLTVAWKDGNDKKFAEMSLLDGKMLIFSDKTIYKVDNVTLLFSLVAVTNPEAFAKKSAKGK